MAEVWKALPGWVRNIVVPIIAVVIAFWVVSIVFAAVSFLLGLLFKVAVVLLVGAVVVVLIKRATR